MKTLYRSITQYSTEGLKAMGNVLLPDELSVTCCTAMVGIHGRHTSDLLLMWDIRQSDDEGTFIILWLMFIDWFSEDKKLPRGTTEDMGSNVIYCKCYRHIFSPHRCYNSLILESSDNCLDNIGHDTDEYSRVERILTKDVCRKMSCMYVMYALLYCTALYHNL